jgi:hypothetical protein
VAQLIIIVEMPDQEPTVVDPHEAAADILCHYEQHREANQDQPEVQFVDAQWMTEPMAPVFDGQPHE